MRTHQRTHLIEANTSSRVAHAKHLAKAAESVVFKTMEDEDLDGNDVTNLIKHLLEERVVREAEIDIVDIIKDGETLHGIEEFLIASPLVGVTVAGAVVRLTIIVVQSKTLVCNTELTAKPLMINSPVQNKIMVKI